MHAIVKVIAHTKFLGVPDDLLPTVKARAILEKEYEEDRIQAEKHNAERGATDGYRVLESKEDVLSEARVVARAAHLVRELGQDVGTDGERLAECAGRACYDSYGAGRQSADYHGHIMDVNHGSVTEHTSLTFFLSAISRGCTHELVRHRVGVAISQRSTRYVDENTSAWVHHPLVEAYIAAGSDLPRLAPNGEATELTMVQRISDTVGTAKRVYGVVVEKLESWLIAKGTDKFTARKQARGAARGYLGNALLTEMVWTCNLRALKNILAQRATAAADAEIRLLALKLYEAALPYWPTYLGRYLKRECPDGIGYELYDPTAPAERLKLAEAELAWLRPVAKTLAMEHTADVNLPGRLAQNVFERYPDVQAIDDGDHA